MLICMLGRWMELLDGKLAQLYNNSLLKIKLIQNYLLHLVVYKSQRAKFVVNQTLKLAVQQAYVSVQPKTSVQTKFGIRPAQLDVFG